MPYVAIQMEAWKTAKTTVVRLCGCLTFILECSVTTKIASNHRGSTKLEFVKTAKLFTFLSSFSDGLSQHCSKYSLWFQCELAAFLSAQVHNITESS